MIAVVGCGNWGKNWVRTLSKLKVLQAVAELKEENFKNEQIDIKIFKDYTSLIGLPGLRGVVIATPAETHFDIAYHLLCEGLDVLVEKPLALTFKEARKLEEIANNKNAILMVGHIMVYHPAVKLLKEMINKGVFGRILYFYAQRMSLGQIRTAENVLWSLGPHDLSIADYLFESLPIEVDLWGDCFLSSPQEDLVMMRLKYPQGVRGYIQLSWLNGEKLRKFMLVGDKKIAILDDTKDINKLELLTLELKLEEGKWVSLVKERTQFPCTELPLEEEAKHFIYCIQNRVSPITDGKSGVRIIKILDTASKLLTRSGCNILKGENQKLS